MRIISFKALLALVVLPPVLYVTVIQGLERYLAIQYRSQIISRIPGDTQALLSGSTRLDDQIETAVEILMAESYWVRHGAMLSVVVRTLAGQRLYPPVYREEAVFELDVDPMQTAGENFALLNEGLDIALTVSIGHNTFISNGVLAAAILVSMTGLLVLYRRENRAHAREEERRQREAETIRTRQTEREDALAVLTRQKENLKVEIAAVQAKLESAHAHAARNEADLFNEVEDLETKLQERLTQQVEQQERIRELEDTIARLAAERQALASQQTKAAGGLRKRMETLYKNASFSDRALAGLAGLPEAMQIKAEEIIQQLNAQADEVPIKRKVFRGKGKESVLEIVFAHKGRLYFRRTRDRKADILAIGTKNTQERDLVYLDRVL